MSVRNPGVSSSVPPTSTSAASASWRLGICPVRRAVLQRGPGAGALTPDQPGAEQRLQDEQQDRVCQPPMTLPTAMIAAISRIGTTSSSRKTTAQPARPPPRARRGGAGAAYSRCHVGSRVPPTARTWPARCSHAPAGDPAQRLAHDVAAHLGVTDLALDEGDRHLDDASARPDGAPGEVDLEAVALRRDVVQAHRAQRARRGRPGSRPWRRGPACRAAPGCRGCRRRESALRCSGQLTTEPPRTQREPMTSVGVLERRPAAPAAARAGASRRRPSRPRRRSRASMAHREPGEVGGAQALLARPGAATCTCGSAAARSSATSPVPSGRVVVEHERRRRRARPRAPGATMTRQVLALVVGRDEHGDAAAAAVGRSSVSDAFSPRSCSVGGGS